MAAKARFHSGVVTNKAAYTPSGADVAAGDVVVVGNTPMVAECDIDDGKLGALNAGGGAYTMTGNGSINAGLTVYWDNATNKVSTTAGSLKIFGYTLTACGGDGQTCVVAHVPRPAA